MTSSGPIDTSVYGRWTLAELRGAVVPDENAPYIELEADGSRVFGSGGCNRLTGTFELSDAGLRFGPVATTRMACTPDVMEREGTFLRALAETTRFDLDGPTLTLLDDHGIAARLIAAL